MHFVLPYRGCIWSVIETFHHLFLSIMYKNTTQQNTTTTTKYSQRWTLGLREENSCLIRSSFLLSEYDIYVYFSVDIQICTTFAWAMINRPDLQVQFLKRAQFDIYSSDIISLKISENLNKISQWV